MNVSEYIFDFFAKKGVDTAFMITGGQAMWLNDAIGKNSHYQIICTHHEQAAAMSADAYSRIMNKPAITLVTAGPGSINALTGVVGGFTDSAPMIIISGQANLSFVQYQNETNIRQFGVQGINIKPIVEHVTKYFVTIDDVRKLKYYLEKAYYLATSGRPGPVWLEVPLDVQKSELDEKFLTGFYPERETEGRISLTQGVHHTYVMLNKSKHPVFLIGQGVHLAKARNEFSELANKLRIPIITSRLGIDLIESDHELYVGHPGNYGERAANFAIQNSDLIIAVGCRMSSSLVGHNPKLFGRHARKLVVDIDEKELNKPGVNLDLTIKADCKDYLNQMLSCCDEYEIGDYESWIQICNSWKKKYPVVQAEYSKQMPINSYYFTDKLSDLAGSDSVILVDTGSCFHVAAQTWKIKKGQHFLTTGGLSSMGYWVAGIGACMANRRKNTIVITGDGSLQMNIQEFATITHNKLPIKVFIFNNNGYLLIRNTQRNFMNDRFIGEGPNTGVACADSLKIAEAYGIKGVRIQTLDEMTEKIKEVLAFEGPVICDIITQEWQPLIPRLSSDIRPDGTLVPRDYEDMYPYLSKDELKENMIGD